MLRTDIESCSTNIFFYRLIFYLFFILCSSYQHAMEGKGKNTNQVQGQTGISQQLYSLYSCKPKEDKVKGYFIADSTKEHKNIFHMLTYSEQNKSNNHAFFRYISDLLAEQGNLVSAEISDIDTNKRFIFVSDQGENLTANFIHSYSINNTDDISFKENFRLEFNERTPFQYKLTDESCQSNLTTTRPFACVYCYSRFDQKLKCEKHKKSHPKTTIDICTKFGLKFKQKVQLSNHDHSLHFTSGQRKEFFSSEDPFSPADNLVKDLKNADKDKVCSVCNKAFKKKKNLTIHMRTHTGEKPFKCDVCNKCFTQKNSLTRHRLNHTGEQPFECNVCNKSFTQKTGLEKHTLKYDPIELEQHKPHECDVCKASFSKKGGLKKHKLTHTNVEELKCQLCNRIFKYKSSLEKHQEILIKIQHVANAMQFSKKRAN